MSDVKRNILIFVLALLFACCATIDIWYLGILFWGKEKVVSKTFNVSTLTLADGTTENIVEVEYFANKDNSGLEVFEVKFTNFMDENKESTYIQGLQYVADENTSIDLAVSHNDVWISSTYSSSGMLGWKKKYYDCQNTYAPISTTSVFNYMKAQNDEQYLKSTNPIDMSTNFKIEVGEDIYLMQFKGLDTPRDSETFNGTVRDYHNIFTSDVYHNTYIAYDVNYFAKALYEAVKSSKQGTNDDVVFEWGNIFNYYKYDESKQSYTEEPTDYAGVKLVSGDIKSYYSIKIRTHESGLTRASDSMFGSVLGNQNFNLTGNYSSEDYFIGRTIIDCKVSNFDFVVVEDNNISLKLKSDFVDYYIKYADDIMLSVEIDLDFITELGYNFVGFTADSGLDKFNIYDCYTVSQGEIVDDYTSSIKVV